MKLGEWCGRHRDKLMLALFGAIAVTCGIAAFFKGLPALRMTLFELPKWVEVQATVVGASLESVEGGTTVGAGGQSRRSDDMYRPRIEYRYTWEGREITSDRYSLVHMASSDRAAQSAVLERYPEGSQTTAYVNPQDPTQAVLDREELFQPSLIAGVGALFSVIGLTLWGILIWLLRKG